MTVVLFLVILNFVFLLLLACLLSYFGKLNKKLKNVAQGCEKCKEDHLLRLSELSHDLRTPLNAVMGYTSLLNNQIHGDLSLKQKKYINKISPNSDRMLRILEDYFSDTED